MIKERMAVTSEALYQTSGTVAAVIRRNLVITGSFVIQVRRCVSSTGISLLQEVLKWDRFLPAGEHLSFTNFIDIAEQYCTLKGVILDSCCIHPSGRIRCSDGWLTKKEWVPLYANGKQWTNVEYTAEEGEIKRGRVVMLVTGEPIR